MSMNEDMSRRLGPIAPTSEEVALQVQRFADRLKDATERQPMEPFHEFFLHAMKRTLPRILPMPDPKISGNIVLNLGPGNTQIPGTRPLDLPYWNADTMPIPEEDGTVDGIHAYHFLEHVADPITMLREIQRVLRVGGVCQLVVPYYTSQNWAQDLTHRSSWCETTWQNLFRNDFYSTRREGWRLHEGFNLIVGQTERNLVLLTQLVKVQ